jgi:hypothetical protein
VTSEERNGSPGPTLATWGQLVAILALLLPVVGVGARIVAFSFDRRITASGGELGAAESVPSLAWTGFQCVLSPMLFLAIAWWAQQRRSLTEPDSPEPPSPKPRRQTLRRRFGRRFVNVLVLLVVLDLLLIQFAWTLTVVNIPLTLLTLVALEWGSNEGKLTLRRAWPALVTTVANALLVGGLALVQVPAGLVVFDQASKVPSGAYSILGMNSTISYLLPCDTNRPMVEVQTAQISSITPFKAPNPRTPGPLPALFGHQHSNVGVFYDCPPRGTLPAKHTPSG